MLGFWTSQGQPNSLEQMGCLASLSSFLGCSLFASGLTIGAHLSSRQSALTSFPAGQQDVFCVSRLSTHARAGVIPPAGSLTSSSSSVLEHGCGPESRRPVDWTSCHCKVPLSRSPSSFQCCWPELQETWAHGLLVPRMQLGDCRQTL